MPAANDPAALPPGLADVVVRRPFDIHAMIGKPSTPPTATREGALLPCPFCGSNKLTLEDVSTMNADPYFSVWCHDCGARGVERAKADDAMTDWNRRVTPAAAAGEGMLPAHITAAPASPELGLGVTYFRTTAVDIPRDSAWVHAAWYSPADLRAIADHKDRRAQPAAGADRGQL